ncbi:cytoplasmic protein, partial [Klebsiella pneumoniae]|nr:cytoplasmic protein [Klebsiella pneumoniae]
VCFAENQLVISTVLAPAILGLIDNYGVFNGLPDKRHCSLFAETDLSGRWIAHQAAVNILNEKNLWQEMAHILTQRLM